MADSLSLPVLLAIFVLAHPFIVPRGPRGPWSA
jgi:hypothetical protein